MDPVGPSNIVDSKEVNGACMQVEGLRGITRFGTLLEIWSISTDKEVKEDEIDEARDSIMEFGVASPSGIAEDGDLEMDINVDSSSTSNSILAAADPSRSLLSSGITA